MLLDNSDVLVTQPVPAKPFPFEPFFMRTKYRFIEGYRGNDTVRGWRDFDSIYHAVFADMRGTEGYPKGKAYSTWSRRDCCCGPRFPPTRSSAPRPPTGRRRISKSPFANCRTTAASG